MKVRKELKDIEKENKRIEKEKIELDILEKMKLPKDIPMDVKSSFIAEKDTKSKPYDVLRTNKSKMSLRYWRDILREKMRPEKTILVNMELLNGFHRLFLVTENDEGFKYRGNKYLFDNEAKYYLIDSKLWCYDYHEKFTLPVKRNIIIDPKKRKTLEIKEEYGLPIRRRIPLTTIKTSLEQSGMTEVEYATNPSTLERFTISKIAEGIMKGQALDEVFKFLKMMLILAVVGIYIHLVLYLFKSGALQAVKIPGVSI